MKYEVWAECGFVGRREEFVDAASIATARLSDPKKIPVAEVGVYVGTQYGLRKLIDFTPDGFHTCKGCPEWPPASPATVKPKRRPKVTKLPVAASRKRVDKVGTSQDVAYGMFRGRCRRVPPKPTLEDYDGWAANVAFGKHVRLGHLITE